MKRAGNLFHKILERDNLRLAVHKALKGKRDRKEAQQFIQELDANLERMSAQLRDGSIPVGRYHQFVIYDPKERIITAPCFAERVLHHAVMNICEPLFDCWLIDDTFACRPGKGRLACLHRAQHFARRFRFFLKLDIRKYFDSIPPDELLRRLERRIKDRELLHLFERIVRSFRGAIGQGVPIGSLTSQHFANFYLGWLDRFTKEKLCIKAYVRYMDDMALWSDDKSQLKSAQRAAVEFLADELQLQVKDYPYLNRTDHGMDFLGCRVFRRHMILNRRSRRRFRRKLSKLEKAHEKGSVTERELQDRATSLIAFTKQENVCSWQCRRSVIEKLVFGHG